MNIFEMRDFIIGEYSDYFRSFLPIADNRVRALVEARLLEQSSLWPDALIQLNPAYAKGDTVAELAKLGKLHHLCGQVFATEGGQPITLYQHQQLAMERVLQRQHIVVASGTGSGKSLTYFIPIFDAVLRSDPVQPMVRAIVVYPMNALVNSQEKSLSDLADHYRRRTGREFPVRFAKYTGQESPERKSSLRRHPPHILLTNYVMLELMLVRPDEHAFVDRTRTALQFLVLDELHTYRGRQGSDVALLVRRLRERCGNPNLVCIGTSATMASGGTRDERRRAIASFASRLFGVPVLEQNVIEETVRRLIPCLERRSADDLRHALLSPLPEASWEDFARNSLSAWVEDTLGVGEEDGHLRSRTPLSLTEAACRLSELTKVPQRACIERLREMLLRGAEVRTPEGEPVFPFKLHQFISQGGAVYATLEPPDRRDLTLEGQVYAPGEGERLLYPLVFCRLCGQEYYTARWSAQDSRYLPEAERPLAGIDADEGEVAQVGYLMLDPEGRWQDEPAALPDHWVERNGRIKREYRPLLPRRAYVCPDGRAVDGPEPGAISCWFLPKPFMLCLSCGEAYTRRDKDDFRKLARLSSEGRSTATTLLSLSAVAAMRDSHTGRSAQKVLSFTDNRQDASLQAGHFNDFVQVALLRSALCQALEQHGELHFESLASRVTQVLGHDLDEFAWQRGLDPQSPQAQAAAKTFQDVVEYRLYEDLRRGWRIIQPNLEQCGLLRVDYRGLDELAQRDDIWQGVPLIGFMPAEQRASFLRVILDEMRRQLAIEVECLDPRYQEELKRRAAQYLNEQWAFDERETLREASRYVPPTAQRPENGFSLSPRSVIGKWLISEMSQAAGRRATEEEYNNCLMRLLDGLRQYGLLVETDQARGRNQGRGFRLPASALIWRPGDGKPFTSPLRRRRARGPSYVEADPHVNQYFRQLYSHASQRLRGMVGAEHTAQIGYEQRAEREERFQNGDLSCLFCSPTMELGIDIGDLSAVHLRNLPPTPANYAQRGGRAGRRGQPALVMAYCASRSGHDQYYFRRRTEMVAGQVVPPRLELSNEDLVRAHVHAIWLASTGLSLESGSPDTPNILAILDPSQPGCPLRQEVREQIALSEPRWQQCLESCRRVLAECGRQLLDSDWYDEHWLEDTLRQAPQTFDRAFDRWRELFETAMAQLQLAQRLQVQAYVGGQAAQEVARDPQAMQREAQRQLDLLYCRNTMADESDFYPYRYLASEGFLPGYNFPALPVRAFLPYGDKGQFISRSRFLALTEFAPGNVIYHEGAKYQVRQAFLPSREPEERFLRAKLCHNCGYVHEGEAAHADLCQHCGCRLEGSNSLYLAGLLEMPTMGARRRERITCDEEERLRLGYQVSTHVHFAPAPGGQSQRRRANALLGNGQPLLTLDYAPSASIWRINHGWLHSREPGFTLDLSTGLWVTERSSEVGLRSEERDLRTNVRLFVRSTANALLLRMPDADARHQESLLASLQYALCRGIQRCFQVEEDELASERIGDGEHRGILLWEATEGGLGILRRLVEEPDALARVASTALDILHFHPETGEDRRPPQDEENGCARACYDCLLSYYNQRDHFLLDRHAAQQALMDLAQSVTRAGSEGRDYEGHYRYLRSLTDTRSELERHLLDLLYRTSRRLPDAAQRQLQDVFCQPDFFYEPNICVFCDGSIHDEPQQRAYDEHLRRELRDRGYRVIAIRYDRSLDEQVQAYPEVFGRGVKP